jgi:hypothetical protein
MYEKKLDPNLILTAEFEYISQTAAQANEDRARVTSFYFVSVGSLVAAILGTQFSGGLSTLVYLAFAGLFLLLTILGGLTIAQLARLRLAWRNSALAMNKIKEYYIAQHKELASAFAWQTATLPKAYTANSIANLMAVEVALLGSITFGVAAIFLLSGMGISLVWAVLAGILCAIGGFVALFTYYKRLLKFHTSSPDHADAGSDDDYAS